MTEKQLNVKTSTLKESLARFKNVWDKAVKGENQTAAEEILSFENTLVLMKMLSPKRLELLKKLHNLGKSSIRNLTVLLKRDYSNVYQDVKSLYQTGLILKDSTGKYYAPWKSIMTEFSLCTENTKPKNYHSSANLAAHG